MQNKVFETSTPNLLSKTSRFFAGKNVLAWAKTQISTQISTQVSTQVLALVLTLMLALSGLNNTAWAESADEPTEPEPTPQVAEEPTDKEQTSQDRDDKPESASNKPKPPEGTFNPTEEISEDYAVSFPVDI